MSLSCLSCYRGFHIECGNPCCCKEQEQETEQTENSDSNSTEVETTTEPVEKSRWYKEDETIGVSAGRKRAAVLYPINSELACEWRALANCGGGVVPIVGCLSGKQQHRHHGPIKSTYHNERSNIHLICHDCHNSWHAANDPEYGERKGGEEGFIILLHEPRPMNIEELLEAGK